MYRFWETILRPLLEALEPEAIVEIGSDRGLNTVNLLEFCSEHDCELHVIDPLPKYDVHEWRERYGETVVFHQELSLNALPRIGGFNAVLVDGDHNWYTVFNELRLIEKHSKEHSVYFPLTLLHDVGWPYGRRDLYYEPENIPLAYRKPHKQKGMHPDYGGLLEQGGLNRGFNNAIYENSLQSGVLTAVEDFLQDTAQPLDFLKVPGFHGLGILVSQTLREANQELDRLMSSLELSSMLAEHVGKVEKDWLELAIRNGESAEALERLKKQHGEEVESLRARYEAVLGQISAEKTALERQISDLRDDAAAQATEVGRLESERKDFRDRYAALKDKRAKLKERNEALKDERAKLKERNEALKEQNEALEAERAALRNSTSWRLTVPVRAAKRLATDPRGTITFLLARYSGAHEQPAASPPDFPQVVEQPTESASDVQEQSAASPSEPTPESAEKKPLPGMERLAQEDVERVRAAFDADFYLERYPDIADRGEDPFEHYMRFGWKEGRDPSPAFSTGYYLRRAPDVAKAGRNPFVHWVLHGIRQRRPALPFHRRLELLDYAPVVSAIVPNYNHAPFLEQRIDSILAQTYENVEVLILDDCSTDGSRDIIERYCRENPGRVRALFNDTNSGSVFRQWRKGIEHSAGELVWICESDDFCEPDFLYRLVGNFKDRGVNIAFGRIQFSDEDGNLRQGLDQYREGAEPGTWDAPLTRPARRWFAGGFGVNNVIPNVGGCIFRRQSLPESVWREAENYSVLGDWFLYVHLAGGGKLSYEPSAVAYFRQHGDNTSVASFVTPGYYEEHERLMLLLRRRWGVPDETVEAFHHKVASQYARNRLEEKLGPLESYCDKQKLLAEKRKRSHILIAFQGFFPGGGEVFPIHLANELFAQGHLVSMLALYMNDVNPEMLDALDPAIPVYDAAWVEEYGADRFLAEAGVSLINSHMIHLEGFFFEQRRIETDIPYLVTLHGSYEVPALLSSNERLVNILLNVTHFVYTAEKNLEPFRALPLSESIFTKLGNAMPEDPRPFPKTRQELGIAEDAVVFTLVARGVQRKGWRAAINAFRYLREAHPEHNLHLLLCGDGGETDRHYALHGDDPDITFLGYQSCINGLYSMSDVALTPTRFGGESFPLSIIQALQEGTPVIATRIGEIESMIEGPEGAAGILIEYQRDTDLFTGSLQEAMAAMLAAPERERYARVAEKEGRTYSMDKVAKDYAAIYDELVEGQDSTAAQQHA